MLKYTVTLTVLELTSLLASPNLIPEKAAKDVLKLRSKRSPKNSGLFEEMGATSLQAECIDEQCSFEEFLEAYQHLPLEQQRLKTTNDLTQEFKKYTSPCDFKGCDVNNTKQCENYWATAKYVCKEGWTGATCSEDLDECQYFPCKNGDGCRNSMGSYHCDCGEFWKGQNCDEGVGWGEMQRKISYQNFSK